MNFINKKFCLKNGLSLDLSANEFGLANKRYYQEIEDYDWVEVADQFQGLEAILHRLREKETLKLIKEFGKGKKFLDAGCGTGLILRHLPTGSVGLDINPKNIKRAKKYVSRINLVVGDIEAMPFTDKSFTTIICTDVLEHLPKPKKAISEIFRLLAPNGILIGSVPAKNPIWWFRFLSSTHPGEPYHRLYRQSEIRNLFKKKGELLQLKKGCLGMNFFFVVTDG